MKIQEVIGSGQLNRVKEDGTPDQAGDEFTVRVENPLTASYAGLPEEGTDIPGWGGEELHGPVVLSVGEHGDLEVRAGGTAGENERCVKQGNLLVFKTAGRRFVIPFAE